MSCLAIMVLTAVIVYFGALIAFFLAAGMVPLAILCLVLIPLALLFIWRIIYPWLVRMGRWSAQLRNLVFLAFILTAIGIGIGYVIPDVPTITIPLVEWEVPATVLVFGLLFLFLLLLGLVVWLVRLWRRGWPLARNSFWDIGFRLVALFWKILLGIPLGIAWFLYHPPLRWLIAALLFYLRGLAAAAAWLLYNPPLRSIGVALLLITRLVGRVIAWLVYNPPIRWVVEFGVFMLRLMARPISTVIYWFVSWWPITGVKGTLDKGLNTESKSYQDYKYA
ncbi:MAG: hypothetical protein A2Z77_00775 [Chloroflexi bacterium RBG_13_51_36]|nr:MAG: hypothetical protein A2Z77_00775 [Chloroflexi bacterium RBG_13_51_36]